MKAFTMILVVAAVAGLASLNATASKGSSMVAGGRLGSGGGHPKTSIESINVAGGRLGTPGGHPKTGGTESIQLAGGRLGTSGTRA